MDSLKRLISVTTEENPNNQSYENGQPGNVEHKAHKQHPNNYGTLPLGTSKEMSWMIRGYIY